MIKKQKYIKISNNRKENEMNKDKEKSDKKPSMLAVAWSIFFALLLLIKDVVWTFLQLLFTCLIPLAIWLLSKFIGWLRQPDKPQKDTPIHNNETRVDNKERARSTAKQMQKAYDLEFEASVALLNEKAKKEQLELDMLAKQRVSDLQLVHWQEFMEQLDKIKKESLATNLVKQPAPALQPAKPLELQPGNDTSNERPWWKDVLPQTAQGQTDFLNTLAIGGLVIVGGTLLGPIGLAVAL